MDGRPLDALEEALGTVVAVSLKDGAEYRGVLGAYDQHMNLVLEPADESQDGAGDEAATQPVEDTTVIRGDNVVTIRP